MGIISLEQTDNLYWLGRYTERVYTTIQLFSSRFDEMLDAEPGSYEQFCKSLEIPNIYTSDEDFRRRYAFDRGNPDSIISNLIRAYDNAIVLRESISSESLSYIQLAIYAINRAEVSEAPLIELQRVADNILAFWGIVDDIIESENIRNTIKVGKRIERIDLYARLHLPKKAMVREVHRLTGRIDRCQIKYDKERLANINLLVENTEVNYYILVQEIEQLVGGL